jgi:hypothetical protein
LYTSVTPKVFKFIGPSNDGQMQSRSTYLGFLCFLGGGWVGLGLEVGRGDNPCKAR